MINPELSLGFLLYGQITIVYILKCSDGTHYIGCTSDVENRLKRHR